MALPFRVVDVNQSLKVGRDFEHVVFDTKARPDREELKTLAEGCDMMVIPTTPDAMSIEALMGTVDMLAGHRRRAVQDSYHDHSAVSGT